MLKHASLRDGREEETLLVTENLREVIENNIIKHGRESKDP